MQHVKVKFYSAGFIFFHHSSIEFRFLEGQPLSLLLIIPYLENLPYKYIKQMRPRG